MPMKPPKGMGKHKMPNGAMMTQKEMDIMMEGRGTVKSGGKPKKKGK